MPENLLVLIHGGAVLLFGVCLSMAFAGLSFSRRNILLGFCFWLAAGLVQALLYAFYSVELLRKLYPLISHLPLVIFICHLCRGRFLSVFSAVFTAYFCCQPANWLGTLVFQLSGSVAWEYCVRIIALGVTAAVAIAFFVSPVKAVLSMNRRTVLCFAIVPAAYYIFDYVTSVYTDIWRSSNEVVLEFFPLFLLMSFFLFCVAYHNARSREEQRQKKESMLLMAARQKEKDAENILQNERNLRILRHDMRALLETLAVSIENDDRESALKMLRSYLPRVEATAPRRWCSSEIINYTISRRWPAAKSRPMRLCFWA